MNSGLGPNRRLSRRRVLRSLALGTGWLAATTAVGALRWPERAAAAPSPTLIVGSFLDIKSLDPGRSLENGADNINHATYDTLVTYVGGDFKNPKPLLASAWRTSPDGRTYTFSLQRNVKFASGNALTSADVKWSFERLMQLQAAPSFLLNGVTEVLAPDPLAVSIVFSEPHPSIIAILASPSLSILDSKLVTEHGGTAANAKDTDRAEGYLNSNSAGSGPFTLASYIPRQEVVLVKNPQYWRGPAKADRVVIRNVAEPAVAAQQVARGDMDIATAIGPEQARGLTRAPGVTVKSDLAVDFFYLAMSMKPDVGGPLANAQVREAVRYAIDYDGLLKILGPGATKVAGIIPVNFVGSLPARDAVVTDRERAKRVLQQAGVQSAPIALSYASDQIKDGVKFDIVAQKIQGDLAAVGLQISLNPLPYVESLAQYRAGKQQMALWPWAADYPDPSNYLVFLPGRLVGNRMGWTETTDSNAREIARLGSQVETETDEAKRTALYQKIGQMVAQYGPYVSLFQPAVPYAFRSDLQGVTYSTVWLADYYPVGR